MSVLVIQFIGVLYCFLLSLHGRKISNSNKLLTRAPMWPRRETPYRAVFPVVHGIPFLSFARTYVWKRRLGPKSVFAPEKRRSLFCLNSKGHRPKNAPPIAASSGSKSFPGRVVAPIAHYVLEAAASMKAEIHRNLNIKMQCAGSKCLPSNNCDLFRQSVTRTLSNMFRNTLQSRSGTKKPLVASILLIVGAVPAKWPGGVGRLKKKNIFVRPGGSGNPDFTINCIS